MAHINYQKYGLEPNVDLSAYGLTPIGGRNATEQLQSEAENIQQQEQPKRTIQPQEEFSNPTQVPGFENLPQQEKLQRIGLSQFDPANQTSTGGMVPPGTYESDEARMISSILPTLLAPQFSGNSILSRYLVDPLANVSSRMATGALGNIGYQLPNIKNKEDLKDVTRKSLKGNAMIETMTAPFRVPSYFAEMFNPLKYAGQKASQIRNEFSAAKAVTDKMYEPINKQYGQYNMTLTPDTYLKRSGVKRSQLYPDSKLRYDEFMKQPTFDNLQKLKSSIGNDWSRISTSPNMTKRSQLFNNMRENLNNRAEKFLSHDPKALQQFNLANEYAKNHYFPYLSTPTLRNISRGHVNVEPEKIASSIDKATKKVVGKEARPVVPEGHALRTHLKDLGNMMNFGKLAKAGVPTAAGAIGGELLHPGFGGLAAGAGAGIGATAGLFSPIGNPFMRGTFQNPWVENVFNKTAPLVYGGGRYLTNQYNAPEKKKKK